MLELKVPKEKFSALDYLLERGDPSGYKGILLTVSAYNRNLEDPYFTRTRISSVVGAELWKSDEMTLDGVHYPAISFVIQYHPDGYIVRELEYDGKMYNFSSTEYDVRIDY